MTTKIFASTFTIRSTVGRIVASSLAIHASVQAVAATAFDIRQTTPAQRAVRIRWSVRGD